MERWTGLAGIAVLLGIAFLLSNNRRRIRWYTVVGGLGLQVALAFLVLSWEPGKVALERISLAVTRAVSYSDEGAKFLFGWLAEPMDTLGRATHLPLRGFVFAFKVLPLIIFICSFFMILYHFGVMQRIVRVMAVVMQKLLRVSGAESLCVAANVFIGQTEAPVLIAPYIPEMTMSEILTMMTGGWRTSPERCSSLTWRWAFPRNISSRHPSWPLPGRSSFRRFSGPRPKSRKPTAGSRFGPRRRTRTSSTPRLRAPRRE